MPGSKRIPNNSIVVVVKFGSRDIVVEALEDPEFQKGISKIMTRSVILGGKVELSKSFDRITK